MNAVTEFFSGREARSYSKGQILLYQAEETNSVFYIKKGYVKVYDISSSGDEKLLLVLGPGDMYPVIWTFRSSDRLLYFYESMSDLQMIPVDRSEFNAQIDQSHDFTKALLKHFVERIKDLSLRVECLEASNSRFKVAQVLQYLLDRHPGKRSGKCTYLALQTTHQIIASMAGATRETASTIIKEFEDNGVVSQANSTLGIYPSELEKFLASE